VLNRRFLRQNAPIAKQPPLLRALPGSIGEDETHMTHAKYIAIAPTFA